MPALLGFSDNPFQSRQDVLRASLVLLKPLTPYKSPCGARIKLPTATGTGFDEIAAQMEGYARPLWVVADLLALQSESEKGDSLVNESLDTDLGSWVRGLAAGVDPDSETFWGHMGDHDQRMVEMEPVAYALLSSPASFFPAPDESEMAQNMKANLVNYLRNINNYFVPPSNWRWFRVLVNLALVKVCGVPYSELKSIMDEDLELLDSFFLGEGWSSDGLWCAEKKQADYYSGSFAIQYSQLAYLRFAVDLDEERCERYREQAREFATGFWRVFGVDGAAIPFGRSLTYRVTFAAFWSAAIVANVSLPPPLNQLGVVKGLLLRHLRWWAQQEDIFNTDGTLNIGYTYPNMYMSEDYSSPQSVYWCFKTLSVLRLSEDHPFWTCEELPHPLASPLPPRTLSSLESSGVSRSSRDIYLVAPAMQILCSTPEHHFLLSSGQFTKKAHKSREAKYSKFAYSSTFAFSVPVGPLLTSMAPDSTISMSNDEGDTWKTRWEPLEARVQAMKPFHRGGEEQSVPTLISTWRPWKRSKLQVTTTLIPPLSQWPGWHVRVHKLTWPFHQSIGELQCVDAGFAVSCQNAKGAFVARLDADLGSEYNGEIAFEGRYEDEISSLILSNAGASGICSLAINTGKAPDLKHRFVSSLLKPDANTNLVAQRTLIPTIHHYFEVEDKDNGHMCKAEDKVRELSFATGVFAVAGTAGLGREMIGKMWKDRPVFDLERYIDCIE